MRQFSSHWGLQEAGHLAPGSDAREKFKPSGPRAFGPQPHSLRRGWNPSVRRQSFPPSRNSLRSRGKLAQCLKALGSRRVPKETRLKLLPSVRSRPSLGENGGTLSTRVQASPGVLARRPVARPGSQIGCSTWARHFVPMPLLLTHSNTRTRTLTTHTHRPRTYGA